MKKKASQQTTKKTKRHVCVSTNEYTKVVFVHPVDTPNSIGARREIQESYVIILRFNGANDDRRLFVLTERDIVLVVHLDVLFVQDTNDLTDIIDKCEFVAELMLIRVHYPVCQQILQRGHFCIRCPNCPKEKKKRVFWF